MYLVGGIHLFITIKIRLSFLPIPESNGEKLIVVDIFILGMGQSY